MNGTFQESCCLTRMNADIKTTPDCSEDDAVMVRAVQTGNREAFDALVIRHKDRVFNICYRLLGDFQEAHDSAQEIFLKVFRSIHRFRFEAAFTTWLYRIVVNTCKNRLNSSEYRLRARTVHLDSPVNPESGATSLELSDNGNSPGNHVERKERMRLVQEAIDALPPDQKTVVTLRDIQGFSYDEIAAMTGLNLGTVKSRLSRARLDLRERLRGLI